MLFNPDAPISGISDDERKDDLVELERLSMFLQDIAIPKFVHDLNSRVSEPLTGKELEDEMHERGINMR